MFACDEPVDQALLQASRQVCKGFKSWQSTAAETLGEGLWNHLQLSRRRLAALSASAAEALTRRIGKHLDHAASVSGNAAVNIGMARSWFSLSADAQKTIDAFHQGGVVRRTSLAHNSTVWGQTGRQCGGLSHGLTLSAPDRRAGEAGGRGRPSRRDH